MGDYVKKSMSSGLSWEGDRGLEYAFHHLRHLVMAFK
jgi:hypothetical protein